MKIPGLSIDSSKGTHLPLKKLSLDIRTEYIMYAAAYLMINMMRKLKDFREQI